MPVVSLPVIPDVYRPIVLSAADAVSHYKAIEGGRERWVSIVRRRVQRTVMEEWRQRVLPAVQRASSVGHATVLVEQGVFSNRDAWEQLLYRLYVEVARDFAARTSRGIKRQLVTEFKTGVEESLDEWGLDDRWLKVVSEWLGTQAGTRIWHIQSTTLAEVRRVLADATAKGEGIPRIARRLFELGPEFSVRRGVTIARTEVIAASNLGSRAGAVDTGLALDHEWLATPGPRTRPWHASANGQSRPLSEPYEVKGERLMFPGDGSLGASASNLILCRCTETYTPAAQRSLPDRFDAEAARRAIDMIPDHPWQAIVATYQAKQNPLRVVGGQTESPAWTTGRARAAAAIGGWNRFGYLVQHGTIEEIEIDKLATFQTWVGKAGYEKHLANLDRLVEDGPVGVVVRVGDTDWLVDGNHRVSLLKLGGKRTVRVLRLPTDKAMPIAITDSTWRYEPSAEPEDLFSENYPVQPPRST